MAISHTGFCWRCGKVIKNVEAIKIIKIGFDSFMFCCKKHQMQYDKMQDAGSFGRGGHSVRRGKKDGYGLAGSIG